MKYSLATLLILLTTTVCISGNPKSSEIFTNRNTNAHKSILDKNWDTFWSTFRAAVLSRNRNKIETLMSKSFVMDGGLLQTKVERMSFLNKLSKNNWKKLDMTVRQGAAFDRDCDCRITRSIRQEFRLENGRWQWSEAWFSGD